MDAPNELEQLDESLSEMTDLLLAGEAAADVTLEGDYEAPTRRERPPSEPDQPLDAGEEVEQAQAAVAAAMRNVADALGPSPEAQPQAPASPAESAAETPPTPADAGAGEEPDPEAAMLAVSEALADSGRQQPDAREPTSGNPAEPVATAATPAAASHAPASPAKPETSPGTPVPSDPAPAAPAAASPTGRAAPAKLVARQAAAMTGAGLCSLVAIALEPIGTRLAATPRVVRHSLAWLAVWTAFNAACVWTYIGLFRAPSPSHGDHGQPARIVGASEPAPEASEKTATPKADSASHGR